MRWRNREVNTSGRYARVWWPDHLEATNSGLLAIHRAIGHEIVGRKLKDGEVVSCMDGDLLNFEPSNWKVVKHGLSKDNPCCFKCGSKVDPVMKNGRYIQLCKPCRNLQSRAWYAEHKHLVSELSRAKRRKDRVSTVLSDTRKSDRKRGFSISEEFVDYETARTLLGRPCSYCGDFSIQMTLDRIDNSIGHTKGNIVSACIRCNLLRCSMPYAAWVVVAKGVREARELGLFESWTGQIHKG